MERRRGVDFDSQNVQVLLSLKVVPMGLGIVRNGFAEAHARVS